MKKDILITFYYKDDGIINCYGEAVKEAVQIPLGAIKKRLKEEERNLLKAINENKRRIKQLKKE